MSVRLLPRTDIELIASFIWHGNMSYAGGGVGQEIPYATLVQMLQRENIRNFSERYGKVPASCTVLWQSENPIGADAIAGALHMVAGALGAYNYNCFDQGEIDGNGTAVHVLTGRAQQKLDELAKEKEATVKLRKRKRRSKADAEQKAFRQAGNNGDVFTCLQMGVEFQQGPSGNWLWRASRVFEVRDPITGRFKVGSDWHRPIGADTREKCAKAARAFVEANNAAQ